MSRTPTPDPDFANVWYGMLEAAAHCPGAPVPAALEILVAQCTAAGQTVEGLLAGKEFLAALLVQSGWDPANRETWPGAKSVQFRWLAGLTYALHWVQAQLTNTEGQAVYSAC